MRRLVLGLIATTCLIQVGHALVSASYICPTREMMLSAPFIHVTQDCSTKGRNCLGYVASGRLQNRTIDDVWLTAASEFKNPSTTLQEAKDLRHLVSDPFIVEVYGRGVCVYYLKRSADDNKAIGSIPCDHPYCKDEKPNFMRGLFLLAIKKALKQTGT